MEKIYHIINSNFGKQSNIGYRCFKIYQNSENFENMIFCSDSVIDGKNIIKINPFGSYISRGLNFLRIKTNNLFQHRKYDIIIFNFFFLLFGRKYFKNLDPMIVHLWEYSPFIIKFLKKRGHKVVLEVPILPSRYTLSLQKLGIDTGGILKKEFKFERISLDLADLILAPSEFVKTNLLQHYGLNTNKIFVNYFGADLAVKQVPLKSKKRMAFGFVGNLSKRKGVGILIDIFRDLPDVDLYLCGRITMSLPDNIPSNIHITGFVDVKKYWHLFDVYVFPSLMEGSSKSIYEAMAHSLPVITTEASGSIVEHGIHGFIIPLGDIVLLKKYIELFINYPELCIIKGNNSYEKIQSGFTWCDYALRTEGIYDSFKCKG